MTMNSNVFLSELYSSLEQKFNLDKEAAQAFVEQMFAVLGDGIRHDKQVKVKGLGTFKTVYVSARESVDVNTGERILIEGRDKLSFSPESGVKELVNRPFAQFETVVVNDGVDADMLSYVESEEVKDEPEKVSEPVVLQKEQSQTVVEEPIIQSVVESPNPVEETERSAPQEEPLPEIEKVLEDSGERLVEQTKIEEEQEERSEQRNSKLPIILLSALSGLFFLLCCFGGYFLMRELNRRDALIKQLVTELRAEKKTAMEIKHQPSSKMVEPIKVVPPIQEKPQVKEVVAPEKPVVPSNGYASLAQKDARVRTGAYQIVGIKEVVTVKNGQNLKSISRTYLGPDMECYVEVLNGVKEVKPGDKVKIPELKLKKRK
ncbi:MULTISPECIES: HU family DNA-binding protein [unclassified Prevotella]|uniref:HU family DNA-binding protein n=1 Tax=unclassified Prevotella TaxID=2638335 RepID=UPI00068C1CAE|nr:MULTISPECIES: HU family DNA-binding protein [unclassified Prevotella]